MKRILLIVCLLSLIILISGCSGTELSQGKYVVLYELVWEHGVVTDGVCELTSPSPSPPEPFYYDASSLYPSGYPKTDDSLKMLYGSDYRKNSPWLIDSRLSVSGINDFPFTCKSGVTIIGVSNNGTIHLLYENKSVDLSPGVSWDVPRNETYIQTMSNGRMYNNSTFNASISIKYSIQNMGSYNKPTKWI